MSSYNRQPVYPVLMVAAGVVLILGSIFWMMTAAPSDSSAGAAGNAANTAGAVNAAPSADMLDDIPTVGTSRIPYPNIKRVSVEDAKAAYDAKSAIFVDSRGELYFDSGHIPGAIPMTDQDLAARIGDLDRNAWIITYCT